MSTVSRASDHWLTMLKLLYCVQNVVFAGWLYVFLLNHLEQFDTFALWHFGIGCFFINVVFILLFQYLFYGYLPATKTGMLALLGIPYLNTLLLSVLRPVPWNQWILDSAFTYAASVILAFTVIVAYGCFKGVVEKNVQYLKASLPQFLFILPGVSGITAFLFINASANPTSSTPFHLLLILTATTYAVGIASSLALHWKVWWKASIIS